MAGASLEERPRYRPSYSERLDDVIVLGEVALLLLLLLLLLLMLLLLLLFIIDDWTGRLEETIMVVVVVDKLSVDDFFFISMGCEAVGVIFIVGDGVVVVVVGDGDDVLLLSDMFVVAYCGLSSVVVSKLFLFFFCYRYFLL